VFGDDEREAKERKKKRNVALRLTVSASVGDGLEAADERGEVCGGHLDFGVGCKARDDISKQERKANNLSSLCLSFIEPR
jgi:hypothetical protein